MLGFDGPFRFDIDHEGTVVKRSELEDVIRDEIARFGEFTDKNSKVYRFRTIICPDTVEKQKHHDWSQVSRLLIDARPNFKQMKIVGIYPTNKKVGQEDQEEFPLIKTLRGEVNLFNFVRFKLNLSGNISKIVKQRSKKDDYAILAGMNNRCAQWVFSTGWEGLNLDFYLYILVPNSIPERSRYLIVNIIPVRSRSKQITLASVYDHRVQLA